MSQTPPRLRPYAPRADELIEAWNRKDVAFVLDQFANDLSLEARSPKEPQTKIDLNIHTKSQLAAALEAYRPLHSRFSLISASEDANSILIALEDAQGDVLVLTLWLAEDGKIERIVSYRSIKKNWNVDRQIITCSIISIPSAYSREPTPASGEDLPVEPAPLVAMDAPMDDTLPESCITDCSNPDNFVVNHCDGSTLMLPVTVA